jgi:hypothetical protein
MLNQKEKQTFCNHGFLKSLFEKLQYLNELLTSYCNMELCDICVDAAKRISNIISSWDPNHPPPPEPELEIYESDPSQRPLSRDSVQHLSSARLLPRSASNCPFCELIRSSLVFGYFQKFGGKEEGFNFHDKFPVADILGDFARNKFLYEPLYSSSPILLEPVQGNGLYRGIAPRDGYFLQSIKVTLRPTPYNKANWYRALGDVQLVSFSDCGKLLATIPSFCQTLIDFLDSPAGVSGGVSTRKPLEVACSPDAFRLLNQWVNGCVQGHDSCRKTLSGELLRLDDQVLPCRRIIDVSPLDHPAIPRLVETKGQIIGRWVALSHCWGNVRPITTTKATLQERLGAIPLESMNDPKPKTFIDAVDITKSLGLRYLWIDSLCIIQDDEDDWKEESVKMGQIYEQAYLTIAASQAYDARFGCFFNRTYPLNITAAINLPFFLPIITAAGEVSSMEAAGSFSVMVDWNHITYQDRDVSACTLGDRGWITQEWILSRRMIHYFQDGMVWICKTAAEDESGRSVKEEFFWKRSMTWLEIVEEHSLRWLTYETDKLISLNGLVTEMQKSESRQGDRYFDGLWEKDLPQCLLWKPAFLFVAEKNLKLHHVPSWSWASRIAIVNFHICKSRGLQHWAVSNLNDFCKIENIEGTALGDTGPARKSQLRIRCLLKPLDDVVIHAPEKGDSHNFTPYKPHRVEEETLVSSGKELGSVLFDDGIHCNNSHLQSEIYILPVVRGTCEGRDWSEGLLVKKTAFTGNEFERIGVAQVNDFKWLKDAKWGTVYLV